MTEEASEKSDVRSLLRKLALRISCFMPFMVAVLFIPAGRLDWWGAWVYIGTLGVYMVFCCIHLIRTNPELIVERMRAFKHKNVKPWDKALLPMIAIAGPLATFLTAGLDKRFGWSCRVPPLAQAAALGVVALSMILTHWAMASNRFFSSVVRIQAERGHVAITSGPYRYVRHPGYVGGIVFQLGTPVALGSLWALVPAGLTACLFVIRTILEDRMLREELKGYGDYAQRVRYRLLPGVW